VIPEFPDSPEAAEARQKAVVVLGSTGSIGCSTLDVVRALPDRFRIFALAAHASWQKLFSQALEFSPDYVVLTDRDAFDTCDKSLLPAGTRLLFGSEGITRVVSDDIPEIVVSAIVGAAGLLGTWAAIGTGKTVALANQETLVVAGQLVRDLLPKTGAKLLPVDSEHSAIFQALRGHSRSEVAKIVLTASGGPFRGWSKERLREVTVEKALNHPTWKMGPKVTIDSATLMNKALEVIEARWLFDLPVEKIDVVVHPESVVHSFVEFIDGSVMAQLSPPDMRLPIQYAMTWPERLPGPTRKLAWRELSAFHFAPPDRETFPALDLGFEVAAKGGTCGAVLNAANEAAVGLFLDGRLSFVDIPALCRDLLNHHHWIASPTLEELLSADRRARQEAVRWITPV